MNEDPDTKPTMQTPLIRRVGLYAVVLLVGLMLGFIPMWLKARACDNSLAKVEKELKLARMRNMLASAVIDARRGDYEPARQAASQFFISLQAETDGNVASNLTPAQIEGVKPLFAGRDEIITLLARSDPASADRLSDLYVSYRKNIPD